MKFFVQSIDNKIVVIRLMYMEAMIAETRLLLLVGGQSNRTLMERIGPWNMVI